MSTLEDVIANLKQELETTKQGLRDQSMKVAQLSAQKNQITQSAINRIAQGDHEIKTLNEMLTREVQNAKNGAQMIIEHYFKDHPNKTEAVSEVAKLGPLRIGEA